MSDGASFAVRHVAVPQGWWSAADRGAGSAFAFAAAGMVWNFFYEVDSSDMWAAGWAIAAVVFGFLWVTWFFRGRTQDRVAVNNYVIVGRTFGLAGDGHEVTIRPDIVVGDLLVVEVKERRG